MPPTMVHFLLFAGAALSLCPGEASAAARARNQPKVDRTPAGEVVRLKSLARFYGLAFDRSTLTLHDGRETIRFERDSRRFWYNGSLIWLQNAPTEYRGDWAIARVDQSLVLDPLLRPQEHLQGRGGRVLVLDPGHGGDDLGAQGPAGMMEKELALEVCRRVRDRMTAQGFVVHLTRDDDRLIDLSDRPRMAASHRADLFLSIHFNSAGNADAQGVETYVLPTPGSRSTSDNGRKPVDTATHSGNYFDGANAVLAHGIHRRLIRGLRAPDRGLRRARFVVLREATCPAVLIECGFLSNAAEAYKIQSSYYLDALAEAITGGTMSYLQAVTRAKVMEP
jgi:N-acetylmuramoyl-L-alanine amidase